MRNPHETEPREWEVWPSVDAAMGDALRAQCPPDKEPFIDIDTGAAIAILRARQPEDSEPGVVRFHVRADAEVLKSRPLLGQKKDLALGVARPPKRHDRKSTVPHVSEVEVSIVEGDTGKLDAFTGQVVAVHELDHAAKMSSRKATRQERLFRARMGANYLGPIIAGESLFWAAPDAALSLMGLGIVFAGFFRIRKMQHVLNAKSPMEKSAYGTLGQSVFYPRVVRHNGDVSLFEQLPSLPTELQQ